jgi:hypothetical protein
MEAMRHILDDVIDDFGEDNIILYGTSGNTFYIRDFSDPKKVSEFRIYQDAFSTRNFRFKVSVDLLGSDYDKFNKLVSDFNTCIKRFGDYGWWLVDFDVNNALRRFNRVTFKFEKPSENIFGYPFNEKEM